jgi:hypothetical protein
MTIESAHVESLKLPSELKIGDWLFDPDHNRAHRVNGVKHDEGYAIISLLNNTGDPFTIRLRQHSYVKVLI